MQRIPGLYFSDSEDKGRGVYTAQEILGGDLIEICPLILIPEQDVKVIHNTALHDYYFFCGENSSDGAIALGLGSLYNHSSEPNAEFIIDAEAMEMQVISKRKIEVGEEICFSYNDTTDSRAKLWFEELH